MLSSSEGCDLDAIAISPRKIAKAERWLVKVEEQECKDYFFPDCSELTEVPFFDMIISKREESSFLCQRRGMAVFCTSPDPDWVNRSAMHKRFKSSMHKVPYVRRH